jgi:hypothetical protein
MSKGAANHGNNANTVALDFRVSCDTFWKYEMKLTVDRNEFVEPGDESNNNINQQHWGCSEKKTATFSRLERHICDAMIAHIHEDLLLGGDENMVQKLCEVSSKFHIHGHTTYSLLYHQSNAPHADHGGWIYICSHC